MKRLKTIYSLTAVSLFCILLSSCQEPFGRSGVVIDRDTNEPIEGVEIDIYMKAQVRDSLKQNVFTDKNGHFSISEKRDADQLFQLWKKGYIGHVNSLKNVGDTFMMEKE